MSVPARVMASQATQAAAIPQVTISAPQLNWSSIPPEARARFLNPGEAEVLAALVNSVRPRRMVEFGCQNGRTARLLLANVPTLESYLGVDVPVGYVPAQKCQRNEVPHKPGELAFPDPRFRLMLAGRGSHDLRAEDVGPCDAAFIDGDHSRAGVERDSALARDCVLPGGIVIWHDYHDITDRSGLAQVAVKEVLDAQFAAGQRLQHVRGTWLVFRRVSP